jgi:squalene synthase HpnC
MPVDHYENFPVASILMPRRLRPAVETIYAFARSADDIADEGLATLEERLRGLEKYQDELRKIDRGASSGIPLFQRLSHTIALHRLPLQPFHDLLSAFSQDVVTTRYETFNDLLDYCRRSANPVGTLMLHLYEVTDARAFRESDAICTALQLINFWQDVAIDWKKDRIYVPLEDLRQFGVSEADIAGGNVTDSWRRLMQFQIDRARAMMLAGAPLALRLPGRIGWELRLVVQGGLRILERIEAVGADVFRHRPKLGPVDWLYMAWRATRMKIRLSARTQLG